MEAREILQRQSQSSRAKSGVEKEDRTQQHNAHGVNSESTSTATLGSDDKRKRNVDLREMTRYLLDKDKRLLLRTIIAQFRQTRSMEQFCDALFNQVLISAKSEKLATQNKQLLTAIRGTFPAELRKQFDSYIHSYSHSFAARQGPLRPDERGRMAASLKPRSEVQVRQDSLSRSETGSTISEFSIGTVDSDATPTWRASSESSGSEWGTCSCIYQDETSDFCAIARHPEMPRVLSEPNHTKDKGKDKDKGRQSCCESKNASDFEGYEMDYVTNPARVRVAKSRDHSKTRSDTPVRELEDSSMKLQPQSHSKGRDSSTSQRAKPRETPTPNSELQTAKDRPKSRGTPTSDLERTRRPSITNSSKSRDTLKSDCENSSAPPATKTNEPTTRDASISAPNRPRQTVIDTNRESPRTQLRETPNSELESVKLERPKSRNTPNSAVEAASTRPSRSNGTPNNANESDNAKLQAPTERLRARDSTITRDNNAAKSQSQSQSQSQAQAQTSRDREANARMQMHLSKDRSRGRETVESREAMKFETESGPSTLPDGSKKRDAADREAAGKMQQQQLAVYEPPKGRDAATNDTPNRDLASDSSRNRVATDRVQSALHDGSKSRDTENRDNRENRSQSKVTVTVTEGSSRDPTTRRNDTASRLPASSPLQERWKRKERTGTDEERGSGSVRFGKANDQNAQAPRQPLLQSSLSNASSNPSTVTNSPANNVAMKNSYRKVDAVIERNSLGASNEADADGSESKLSTLTDAARINKAAKQRASAVTIMAVGNASVSTNGALSSSTTRSEIEQPSVSVTTQSLIAAETETSSASAGRNELSSETSYSKSAVKNSSKQKQKQTNEHAQAQAQAQSRPGTDRKSASASANAHLVKSGRQKSVESQHDNADGDLYARSSQTLPAKLERSASGSEHNEEAFDMRQGCSASLTSSILSVGSSASVASVVLEVKKMLLERSNFDDKFGFTIYRQKSYLVVASVDANSEAWLQGLRVGDRILKLNRVQSKSVTFVDAVQTISNSLRLVLYVATKRVPDYSSFRHLVGATPMKAEYRCRSEEPSGAGTFLKCALSASNGYFGFALAKKRSAPSQIFIAVIDIPSPAHNAGLKENDLIVQVNGVDITTIDYAKLISILRASPSVTMVVKRD